MFVARKPINRGRESHTNADCDTGCIIFVEPYEGKERTTSKEFSKEYGKNPPKVMRCTKQWLNSRRTAIVDFGFACAHLARGFAENGRYIIGIVKSGHSKFSRRRLLSKSEGERAALHIHIQGGMS
jgi:hypothetical protein